MSTGLEIDRAGFREPARGLSWPLRPAGVVGIAAAVGVSLAASGLIALVPPSLTPYFVAGFVMAALSLLFLVRPAVLIWFVVFTSAISGMQSTVEDIYLGQASFSVSGMRWVFLAGFLLVALLVHVSDLRLPRVLVPLAAFAVYVVARWATSDATWAGLKDVLFYGLPLLAWLYGVMRTGRRPQRELRTLRDAMFASAMVLLLLYVVLFVVGAMAWTPEGPYGTIQPRSTSLYLLVVLGMALAGWRYERPGPLRWTAAIVAAVAFGLIVFTFSRTASAVAFSMVASVTVDPLRRRQILVTGLLGAVLFLSLAYFVPALESRFFFSSDLTVSESLSDLNTMGRSYVWPRLYEEAVLRPFFGHGPGTARSLVASVITTKEGVAFHPHNEYLQVFHDLGAVGLAIFLVAWLRIAIFHWSAWREAARRRWSRSAQIHMGALLAIGAILLTGITDNTFHYAFVVVPASLLSALGIWAVESSRPPAAG